MALSIKPYIENKERIHLIGIGGVSMNSLGELLLSRGVPISGSDRLRTDVTARLEALGAKITYEHKPENVEGASLIVRTAAVHDDNPEIVRAHELGIPVMERAEAWGHLMRDYDNVVCLAGTHGKTTSTSMMTLMTMEAVLWLKAANTATRSCALHRPLRLSSMWRRIISTSSRISTISSTRSMSLPS